MNGNPRLPAQPDPRPASGKSTQFAFLQGVGLAGGIGAIRALTQSWWWALLLAIPTMYVFAIAMTVLALALFEAAHRLWPSRFRVANESGSHSRI